MTRTSQEAPARNEAIYDTVALTASLAAMLGSVAITVVICLGGVLGILSEPSDASLWTLPYLAAFTMIAAALVIQAALPDDFVRSAGLLFVSALLGVPTLAAAWVIGGLLAWGFSSVAGVVRGVAGLALILIPMTCVIITSAQLTIFTERSRRERLTVIGIIVGGSVVVVAAALIAGDLVRGG
ncbi:MULTISPECIES: hypothetical protein [unclassified Microbacterium]|uniref:hypothetical protein n=1 Tax=unclassified Microbacterium TaxID=2609290 RepID=UPI003653517B